MLQKGRYGGVLELPRRQLGVPGLLLSQSLCLISMPRTVLRSDRAARHTGPRDGYIRHVKGRSFWDSSYCGLRASSSTHSSYRPRKAQRTRVLSEDNTCTRVTSGQGAPAGGRDTTVLVRGKAQC